MALDLQSNWNVEMSQPFKIPPQQQKKPNGIESLPSPSPSPELLKPPTRELQLPSEIVSQILSFIPLRPRSQYTFWSCALVCRTWYGCAIPLLYVHPHLDGSNFSTFIRTICPSKNAHIRQTPLSVFVKRLDMSELVHNSSRSLTARILGRLKGNIEGFVAPQASFGINSFAALSKCTRLRVLDLSLISASISNRLLFQTLKSMTELETLFFPRSSSLDEAKTNQEPYTWPPKLKALHLAGGINDHFLLEHLINVPKTLSKFSIQHCSQVHASPLLDALQIIGPQIQHLTIRPPMSQLAPGSLDDLFRYCNSLTALRISADYITESLFCHSQTFYSTLRILDIEASPMLDVAEAVGPDMIHSLLCKDVLQSLRVVRVSSRLGWTRPREARIVESMEDILEDNEEANPLGFEATGVWEIPEP
ncbi:hypothetical protein B0J14DRAFT_606195 [Halenospora varia]|nr:hypothetical protein B0J14DRAFT_606195 [Halenospora varia]